jgi:hypothetical protein
VVRRHARCSKGARGECRSNFFRRAAKRLGENSWNGTTRLLTHRVSKRMRRSTILLFASGCVFSTWGCAHAWQPSAGSAHPDAASPIQSLGAVALTRPIVTHTAASELRLPLRLSRLVAAQHASQYLLHDRSRFRLAVSLNDRMISALAGKDTVFKAPVGVATGLRLAYAGRSWRFNTPRGTRRVLRKTVNPVWTPPDWHYAETAYNYGLRLARLPSKGVSLRTGAKLVIRDSVVGIVYPGREFAMLPTDEHLVFDGRVFIPPVGTLNRRVTESLGEFALDLGGGYLIHGTSNEASIGQASSHGCIRMRDDDLVWLFENVPVGTRVVIH